MRLVPTQDFKPVLRACFETDPELVSRWHIAAGQGLEACVEKTYGDLIGADPSFVFFQILDGNRLVGYFGTEETKGIRAMTGFFICPAYRSSSKMSVVWDAINKYFQGKPYATVVYDKNTRAINFLLRNGARHVASFEHDSHKASVFCFNIGVE